MVMVVREKTNEILYRGEAWEIGSVDKAINWAVENGYTPFKDEITAMGNMIIYVW